jgi:hypothetical protein
VAVPERPTNGEDAMRDPLPVVAPGTRDAGRTLRATRSVHDRWRARRSGEVLRLAGEADMFVWEKVRLRDLRDDLDAETRRRHAREPLVPPGEAPNGSQPGRELVDFERDSWPR